MPFLFCLYSRFVRFFDPRRRGKKASDCYDVMSGRRLEEGEEKSKEVQGPRGQCNDNLLARSLTWL